MMHVNGMNRAKCHVRYIACICLNLDMPDVVVENCWHVIIVTILLMLVTSFVVYLVKQTDDFGRSDHTQYFCPMLIFPEIILDHFLQILREDLAASKLQQNHLEALNSCLSNDVAHLQWKIQELQSSGGIHVGPSSVRQHILLFDA